MLKDTKAKIKLRVKSSEMRDWILFLTLDFLAVGQIALINCLTISSISDNICKVNSRN